MKALLPLAIAALALAGCAAIGGPACGPGEERAVNELLYFGTARPGGIVTPSEWAQFLAGSVTPRFPQGLTAWDAAGQWRGTDGSLAREATHVLSLVHPDDAAAETAVVAIVADYKRQFGQESVLRVRTPACASF